MGMAVTFLMMFGLIVRMACVSISVRMTIVTHDRCLSILEVEFVVWFGDDNMSAPLAFPPLYLWLIFP